MTTRYVNTASTAGGNGTTNATSGATRAYASLAEWEAAEQAILTEDHEVLCEGATADTACTIDGWTVGSFKVTVKGNTTTNGKHAGVYSTSKYRIEASAGAGGLIVPVEEKTVIRDFIVYNTATNNTAVAAGPVGVAVQALNLIVRGGASGTGIGIAFQDAANSQVVVKNCIVYDHGAEGIYVRQGAAGSGDAFIVNNTVADCGTGIRGRGAGAFIQAWNNLAFSNTADWVDGGGFDDTNSGNNAFGNSGTACPGTTDIDLSAYVDGDVYLDATTDDFHLDSAGSAYSLLDNNGVGPSSNADVPTDDIDGDTRSGTTTSVGADVIVSGGATIAIGVGTLTLTGYAQTLNSQIPVASNSILVTGLAPTVLTNTVLDVGVGSLVFTGYGPSSDFSLSIANGALTLTGYAAGIQDYLPIGSGTLTLSGFAPSIVESTLLPIDLGQLSLTGYNLTLDNQFDFGSVASIILTGYDLSLSTGAQTIAIGVGELLLSNYAPQLVVTAIEVPLAEIIVTGYAVQFNSSIGIGSADILLTGLAPSLQTDIPILYGALSISGFAPDLVTSTSSIDINLGQLSFSGYAISLITGYPTVDIGVGTLTLTSYAIGIEQLLLIRNTDLRSDAALTSQRPDATLTNQRLDVTLTSKRTST